MSLQSNLINIVLVETSHPGNIGSVARAMKTMGLSRLSLVNPRKFPSGEANALSGNATDVLDNATVYSSIEEAIKDSTYVYATSSRNRTIQWPTLNAEQAAVTICDQSNNKKGVSILFGREDRGLTNEELQLANTHIEIPANPEYPVLNLAMSTQILCYEIFKASHDTEDAFSSTRMGLIPIPTATFRTSWDGRFGHVTLRVMAAWENPHLSPPVPTPT